MILTLQHYTILRYLTDARLKAKNITIWPWEMAVDASLDKTRDAIFNTFFKISKKITYIENLSILFNSNQNNG